MPPRRWRDFTCRRCGLEVRICSRCDHGNIYCRECSGVVRRESIRKAAQRQREKLKEKKGPGCFAKSQKDYRTRQALRVSTCVSHQGSPAGGNVGEVSPAIALVAACGAVAAVEVVDNFQEREEPSFTALPVFSEPSVAHCHFCGTACGEASFHSHPHRR